MIRPADLRDLEALLVIENHCFELDRLSRRSFRYMLTRAKAMTLVYEEKVGIRGYVILLFNRGTSMARLYSIAVVKELQGQGIGRVLVKAAENAVLAHGSIYLRLEIRPDNQASQNLFRHLGYRQFGVHLDYYEDHMEALRFEKHLGGQLAPVLAKVPYYEQTLEFTCGPATLMMAMKALDERLELNRRLELRLWRESTTVFMTSGHGGCGPYGLALSAYHRGFGVEIYVNDEGALFVDSVRSEEKKEVIRLVQADFLDEIGQLPIALAYRRLALDEMKEKFDAGGIPVILISSYRIYREKFPHWVVVTGFDERYIYVHDPFIDFEKGKSMTDSVNMPILQQDFERMSRYGKSGQRAALVLSGKASAGVV